MKKELRSFGRAKNSILAYFERTLYVPKIYLDASWNGQFVDVLAIDRDGGGDVHAVLLYGSDLPIESNKLEEVIDDVNDELSPFIEKLFLIPAQYKYVAAVGIASENSNPLPGVPVVSVDRSYASDGVGRIGYLSVDTASEEGAKIKVLLKPERFRAKVAQLANDYIEHHTADWEIRP